MMKGLVASALLLGLAAPALAKPPFEYHREFHRDARPPTLVDRGGHERMFDRAARSDAAQQRDAAKPTPFSRLTVDQKEKLCAQTGVCVRAVHSDDVEDKTK